MRGRPGWVLAALLLAVLVSTLLSMCLGSVSVPLSSTLRFLATGDAGDPGTTTLLADIRMPRVVTAALAGAGLGVAGLLMQTLFANPLADPYILGVSSGASLGVALAVLGTGAEAAGFTALFSAAGRLGTVAAAALGAFAVLAVVLLIGRWVRSVVSLLIIGVMIGSAVSAVVSLLLAYSDPTRAQKFVLWGLGSVGGTTWPDLAVLAPVLGLGLVLAAVISPAMNALLLGERYAASMGVHVRRIRTAGDRRHRGAGRGGHRVLRADRVPRDRRPAPDPLGDGTGRPPLAGAGHRAARRRAVPTVCAGRAVARCRRRAAAQRGDRRGGRTGRGVRPAAQPCVGGGSRLMDRRASRPVAGAGDRRLPPAGTRPARTVLTDLTLTAPPATVTVLLGPNGAGKSTLLRSVAGLQPVQGGTVRLDGGGPGGDRAA